VLILDGLIERGTVFTVLFSVMMGSMALGNAGPQIAVLAAAKGAGAAIFEIIDKVSIM
jgi:ATP-binding cassette subfamily B (MDR/TAP) protein 1